MRNLDTAWLRTLVAVADNGSFARAAQAVNRSESAVSLQIGNLERETGAKLFRREGRRMVLTGEGLTLLDYARQALDLHDGVLKQLNQEPGQGTVRIGMPQDFVNTWLPAVTASLSRKHPRVHLRATVGRSPDVIRCLDEGGIDLAMVYGEANGCLRLWSGSLSMVWIGTQDFMVSRSNPLPLAVFDPPCAFRGAAIDALEGVGLPWTVAFASPTLASLWGAVGAGLGVTVRTPLGLPPGLKIMREGLPTLPSVSLGLYSARAAEVSQAASSVAGVIAGVVDQSLQAAI